ncbi:hypothetical protein [Haladaptatus sp. DYF46]|uniref:hypothetical protein n=1 Tax=Haladaptatus sp. DYF46 TaxID=2886041 RepID=UPI001E333AC4|nr:hypothetical protein [Haladaptatus sp. DYF46]
MTDDKGERSNRLASRFERKESSSSSGKPDKQDKTGKQDNLDKQVKPDKQDKIDTISFDSEFSDVINADENVKDRPGVLMFLPKAYSDELDIQYQLLSAQYQREHGEKLGKGRTFYPAVIKAGLESDRLPELLGIGDSDE